MTNLLINRQKLENIKNIEKFIHKFDYYLKHNYQIENVNEFLSSERNY